MPLELYHKDHQFQLASQKIYGAFMPQIHQETGAKVVVEENIPRREEQIFGITSSDERLKSGTSDVNYYYAKWTKSCDDVRWFPTTCMNGKGASLDRFGLWHSTDVVSNAAWHSSDMVSNIPPQDGE
uniref:Uncharacterized protein n=1 Tax=Populus trichocarpa TaxID=3694 RepID=U7DWR0_POPTR